MSGHDGFIAVQRPRAAARHKSFEPIILRLTAGRVRAHMLDISTSGALVHADMPPLAGARVTIESEMFVAAARVVWVRAKRFGIQFDNGLPASLVDRALRLAAPQG
ncbi:MAG: PilZ domain-containing protein [Sphingobium sp.]